ncbi:primosomal protein N' [Alkalicaulis satelles]|uniref:Replication restart protein PriA n=1 Tax=Alkalicaulis satelles TaxID=2609175 RepID=A0A5M6ZFW6_9PROT|nr:primosomal protein N' [Alkalicaulis satelles]KAA5803646.1 primosomal protein N' [Alkalicaulis satelles]
MSAPLAVRASVLFPMPLPEPFDYAVPDGVDVRAGDHVLAPLGQRTAPGVVWALRADDGSRPLKSLTDVIGGPPLGEADRAFVDWCARYLVEPPGVILRALLRSPGALRPSPVETVYHVTGLEIARLTPARRAVLEAAAPEAVTAAELARRAGVSSSVVTGLAQAGALRAEEIAADPPFDAPDPDRAGLALTPLQEQASAALRRMAGAGGYQAALLDGVTGSGKTEVYFEAAAEILRREPDAQVLVLLPEIALTQAVTRRFAERFGAEPAVWHSGLSDKARRRVWREAASGRARIVAGARSAVFLPMRNLRCIIVDEEHDPTYKQDEMLTYNARDLAVARSRLSGALCVLASATPSLESLVNAESGRYVHVRLPARAGGAVLPDIELLDLRLSPPEPGDWLSPTLAAAAAETLARGEQVMFYLNRRGYAPLVLCKACGHKMKSPEADRFLVEHRYTGRLVCHVTGFSMPRPEVCPSCGAKDSLISVGPGVERVAEEARRRFPDQRIEVFSSDTAQGPDGIRALVSSMEKGEIDILVGTQIAAKGHNFPRLTLVGVVDADLGLAGADLRAGERTYQTLVQAAGRAGRADRPGRAILQTWNPDHEALQALAAGDREAFLAAERSVREMLGLPPFGRLAALILSGPDPEALETISRSIAAAAPLADGVEVFGPADPPLSVVRGRWRKRFLVQAGRQVDISAYMRAWASRFKTPPSIRVSLDIEPYSFL